MANHLEQVQSEFLSHLKGSLAQPVYEIAIVDADTVIRSGPNKQVEPYFAIQFGEIQQEGSRNVASSRFDEYVIPIYIQAIAAEPATCRRLTNKLEDVCVGYMAEWTGEMKKRAGGYTFPINSSNGSTEAYQYSMSYSLPVQLA